MVPPTLCDHKNVIFISILRLKKLRALKNIGDQHGAHYNIILQEKQKRTVLISILI